MQSGIISSNKSEKFNSFISSWGDLISAPKNSKACIKTIKATNIDMRLLICHRWLIWIGRVRNLNIPVGFLTWWKPGFGMGRIGRLVGWKGLIGIWRLSLVELGESEKRTFFGGILKIPRVKTWKPSFKFISFFKGRN